MTRGALAVGWRKVRPRPGWRGYRPLSWAFSSASWAGALLVVALFALPAQAQDAAALRAKHAALREQLASNPFHRPLYLESSQTAGDLKGDIYALIDQPYATVGQALQRMDHWCDILILHLNVKLCQAWNDKGVDTLRLAIGRKFDQPLADAYQTDFAYKVRAAKADYLQLELFADKGPLGTSNYRIVLEAVPVDAKQSFIHMSYSYAYGMAARLAMQGYLATVGRDKVGFSVVDHKPDGKPVYVGNVRGVVERNTMRYYIAIEAYLAAYAMPAAQQVEKRLVDWHTGVERYPVQLHELDRNDYLAMKRKEIDRQRDMAAAPTK